MHQRFAALRFLSSLLLLATASAHAATFQFTFIDNPSGAFAQRGWLSSDSLYQRNFRVAGQMLGNLIESDAVIKVTVSANSAQPRYSTSFYWGRSLGTMADGIRLMEPSALTRAKGLASLSAVDITMDVNPEHSDAYYWQDPSPEDRQRAWPADNKPVDLVSVVLHELIHGLGIVSRRNLAGQYTDNVRTAYDRLTRFEANGALVFFGPEAVLYNNGAPVKLTALPLTNSYASQNNSHIGDCSNSSEDMGYRTALMNGCSFAIANGRKPRISPLDYAMLADMGYPMRSLYFPDSGKAYAAVVYNGKMSAAVLKRVDAASNEFALDGFGDSNRPATDAVFNGSTVDFYSMSVNDTLAQYGVTLQYLNTTTPRFKLANAQLH